MGISNCIMSSDGDKSIESSHECMVLHMKNGNPVCAIIDDEMCHKQKFVSNEKTSCSYKIKCDQIFAGDTQRDVGPVGTVIIITLLFDDKQKFEFTIIPDNIFITTLIDTKVLHFLTSECWGYFIIPIDTDIIENVYIPSETSKFRSNIEQ